MSVALMIASCVGGVLAFAALVPFGWAAAIIAAPVAASLLTLVTALLLAYRRSPVPTPANPMALEPELPS